MFEDLINRQSPARPEKGRVLISEPMLQDKSFQRSVIYLCHHNEEESVGYILNRPSEQSLSILIKELEGIEFPLYFGGPVDLNSLHFIHTYPEWLGGEQIEGNIYWSGDLEQAIEYIKIGKIDESGIRFFAGYSGWGSGQLDAEMDMQSWLVAEVNPEFIFNTPNEELWTASVKKLGANYKTLLFVPEDPQFN
ncbi:MAG: YqgE/AlgH family protein [Chitinophagaceae bacterium]|jgi:putative transcriptional regulator|nr:YqgE/AlgH family protein [Bacteroidota bacterium]MBP9934041.1 YqgE/AlgH family protein [Chitinophagaceae bacterium]